MRFVFDETKATQAAAYLLEKAGGSEYLLTMIKLLYFADRQALIEGGYPITGDHMVSMKNGPVLSGMLDLINYGSPPNCVSPWCKAISERDGQHRITLIDPPGSDDLSEFETEILDRVYAMYGHINRWTLEEMSLKLPEYQDPGDCSEPIDPVRILQSVGYDSAEIRGIVEDVEERRSMRISIEPC